MFDPPNWLTGWLSQPKLKYSSIIQVSMFFSEESAQNYSIFGSFASRLKLTERLAHGLPLTGGGGDDDNISPRAATATAVSTASTPDISDIIDPGSSSSNWYESMLRSLIDKDVKLKDPLAYKLPPSHHHHHHHSHQHNQFYQSQKFKQRQPSVTSYPHHQPAAVSTAATATSVSSRKTSTESVADDRPSPSLPAVSGSHPPLIVPKNLKNSSRKFESIKISLCFNFLIFVVYV